MADDVQTLLLSINATTEVLRDQLNQAEKATADFQKSTEEKLGAIDSRYYELGEHIGEGIREGVERLKDMAEGAVVALIGENLLETGKKALEFAGHIGEAAEALGVGTTFLQQFHYAALQTGASVETADGALSHLGRAVGEVAQGNTKMIALFDQLGVKVYDQAGHVRSLEALYPELANAIGRIPDAAQRAITAQELLGKGATSLIPLLEQGANGFSSLASAADQLGIVLSPELIEHSEKVNQKLAATKQILDAEMASAVANNAAQIEHLAGALEKAAVGALHFASAHPEIAAALAGGIAGAATAGPIGFAVGTAGGFAAAYANDPDNARISRGSSYLRSQGRFSGYMGTRAQALAGADEADQSDRDAIAYLTKLRAQVPKGSDASRYYAGLIVQHGRNLGADASGHLPRAAQAAPENKGGTTGAGASNINNSAAISAAQTEITQLTSARAHASGAALTAINQEIQARQREIGFLKQGLPAEEAKALASKEASIINKDANDSRRAQRDAEREREKALQADLAYRKEELNLRKSIVDGARKSTANDAVRDALEKEIINAEADNLKAQIADRLSKGGYGADKDGKPTAQAKRRAGELTGLVDQDRGQKLANVDLDALSRSLKIASDKAMLDLAGTTELAQLDERLATTRSERLAIELKLLDLQERAAKAAQQAIIDDPKSSPDQVAAARTRIGQIDAQHSRNVGLVERQNAGPLEGYAQQLRGSVGDIHDDLQTLEVQSITHLGDSLESTATKALHLHGILGDIANDLLKMFIQREIELPIANSLLGGGGSSGGGASAGGLMKLIGGLFGGGRATGGGIDPSKFYLVGEQGPELFAPGTNGTVVSNKALRQPGISRQQLQAPRMAGGATTVHVEPSPYFDVRVSGIAQSHAAGAEARATQAGADLAAERLSWSGANRMGAHG